MAQNETNPDKSDLLTSLYTSLGEAERLVSSLAREIDEIERTREVGRFNVGSSYYESPETELRLQSLMIDITAAKRTVRNLEIAIDEADKPQRQQRHQLLLKHKNVFLALLPDHDRTSCSDDNICNAYHPTNGYRCRRCFLLAGADSRQFDVDILITVTQIEEEE